MDKKYNLWLIVSPIVLIIISLFLLKLRNDIVDLIILIVLLLGSLVIPFGAINYTKLNNWAKVLITLVLAIFLFAFFIWLFLIISGASFGLPIII